MQPLHQLLQQRMDRKTFLRTIGLLALGAIGLGALLQANCAKPVATPKDTYGA